MPLPCASNGLQARNGLLLSAITSQRRAYNVAVVGGGITGLTAAWKLMRDPKCTAITLYEKSHKLGGWMESEEIPVGDGKVVFEYGPRTLKWSKATGEYILDMVRYTTHTHSLETKSQELIILLYRQTQLDWATK